MGDAHPERMDRAGPPAGVGAIVGSWVASMVMARLLHAMDDRQAYRSGLPIVIAPPLTRQHSYVMTGGPDAVFRPAVPGNEYDERAMSKTGTGNFFEDFRIGQVIGTRPRAPSPSATSRSTTACSARASRCSPPTHSRRRSAIRARRSTTSWSSTSCSARPCPDISLNAVANLGYAACRFLRRSIRATRSPRCRR